MPVEVLVPPLGTNVDTLLLTAWLIEEGATVEAGQPLFSVETDKATLDVEAPASGRLSGITARAGDEVPVLGRIAYLLAPGETLPADALRIAVDAIELPRTMTQSYASQAAARPNGDRPFVSPRARRLAEVEGIEWRWLTGSGPDGAILEQDVRGAISGSGSQAIPMSGTRAVIAERMLASATSAALVTLTAEVDATELVDARQRTNASGSRVSYNDYLVWLLGKALTEHPRLNTRLDGEVIRFGGAVHLGVAVDTERGLIVPVLREVQRKSLQEVASESAVLVRRARDGTAGPSELSGSTFTLTNLGAFGIDAFTPLPNLPEGAILGVGRIKPSPAVVDGELRIRQHVWLSLTFDHQLLDGAPAARFLQRFAEMIGNREVLESA